MLVRISIMAAIVLAASGCKKSDEGRKRAEQQAAEESKKVVPAEVAKKINPPVPGGQRVPCTTLIDVAAFQTALGEKEPMTLKEVTGTDADAAASCSLVRGGKRPDAKEQAALIKKQAGRLGVIPGDPTCNVTAYCWTIEEDEKFKERCKQQGFQLDESMGSTACVQIVAQGADDVFVYKFLDPDTKCLLKVRGGPSMVDNAYITTCAKAARDSIGPANIKPGATIEAPGPAPSPGSASAGSGSAPGTKSGSTSGTGAR